ncbi:MAG: iron-sulfur cluster repair di-iron protein [Niabella sp.]|nr:MAG: iron-sulfur cluster repair di-iron protein [Niabella sp.]
MNITEQSIIGDLVANDYRTATVFKKYGIDFCCNGNRTIQEACEKKNLETESVVSSLTSASATTTGSNIDYQSWPLDLLADYIEKKHHRYVETRIKEIMPFLQKIVRVHGERHPELLQVEYLFTASAAELTEHMAKEEQILFPYIRKIVTEGTASASFGTVQNPIAVMMEEHAQEGERFEKISELTNQYTPPADACNSYMVTFSLLKEFEEDLHLHIHLENNILFPKSIELEKQISHS